MAINPNLVERTATISLDELRGQFQGWIIAKGIHSADFRALDTGEYFMPNIESAWQAWLACAIINGVVKQ